jgi:hypothetical protein
MISWLFADLRRYLEDQFDTAATRHRRTMNLLHDIRKKLEEIALAGPKEQAALEELQKVLEQQSVALEALEAHNADEDETDTAEINKVLAEVQDNTRRMQALTGATNMAPGEIIDAQTGRPIPPETETPE